MQFTLYTVKNPHSTTPNKDEKVNTSKLIENEIFGEVLGSGDLEYKQQNQTIN